MLDDIRTRLLANDMKISEALARALPKLRGKASDDTLIWCSNELQGYPHAIEFYNRRFTDLPPYRVVAGVLKVIQPDGQQKAINHAMAMRTEYFLSASVGWLEDFSTLPGELSVVELPELTTYIGKETGGTIVCQCTKTQLVRIIASVKQSFLNLLDKESWVTPVKPKQATVAVPPPSLVPVKEVHSSETTFTKVRAKSIHMMRDAYQTKDWVMSTLGDESERQYIKAAIDYMLKMGFARTGSVANIYLLTEQGARELENSTREFDRPK